MNNMATAAYAIEKTAQKSSPIENQKRIVYTRNDDQQNFRRIGTRLFTFKIKLFFYFTFTFLLKFLLIIHSIALRNRKSPIVSSNW